LFPSDSESLSALKDAELVAVGADYPHISKPEHTLVDRGAWIGPGFSSK